MVAGGISAFTQLQKMIFLIVYFFVVALLLQGFFLRATNNSFNKTALRPVNMFF